MKLEEILSEAPLVLREVALSPAWQTFFKTVEEWLTVAQEELEASNNYNEFLETRAGLRVLRQIRDWKFKLMEDVQTLRKQGDTDGNGYGS